MARIAIVGAGVAGGVVARGLRAYDDLEIIVVEKVAVGDHAEAGNGLNIGPNALSALDLALPEMAEEMRAASRPWTRWHGETVDGEPLFHIPLEEVADQHGIRIRWSELYRIAREPVADRTLYERCCSFVQEGAEGRLDLVLEQADGRRETLADIDLLIACDGRYSALREQRCGVPPVTHLGVANFRLLIEDGGSVPIDDLAEWYNGPNRLLAFRVADGRIYLSGNFPIPPGEEIEPTQKTAAALQRAYLPRGGTVNPLCSFLVEASCAGIDTLHWSRAQEIPTCFTDGSGRFLMLGDSAHAMVPTLGQGATQALEDGSLFLLLYERMRRDGAVDFAAMIRRYEALRRTRIEFARSFSWEASKALLAGSDSIAATRGKSQPAYRSKLTRLYRELEAAAL